MAGPNADSDLINFDIIETHKENIQQLPGGRSAKQLASILSPMPSGRASADREPTLGQTKTLNDAIRQEYENELQSIADSDDPLDVYDRYVKWTLNAYPSAQATPQSQLLPLLERATKAFLASSHYKNDPRYLKLWLHYIRLFSDAPRETFAFLAQKHIGEQLATFYEEFAAWLESAGRWTQADEVYAMGIEKEARPVERLRRKHQQFQERFAGREQTPNEPSSPALPTVRPALAAKMDPFAPSHSEPTNPQSSQPRPSGTSTSRSGKPKMAIFSDASAAAAPAVSSSATKGWDSIGSMKERKKENAVEARPWSGETLTQPKKLGGAPKMEIFKDPSTSIRDTESKSCSNPSKSQMHPSSRPPPRQPDTVNPRTGRAERVFVNIEAVYPPPRDGVSVEFSFEELRAMHRGWMGRDWRAQKESTPSPSSPVPESTGDTQSISISMPPPPRPQKSAAEEEDVENISQSFNSKIDIGVEPNDISTQSLAGMPSSQMSQTSTTTASASSSQQSQPSQSRKERKTKIREVHDAPRTVALRTSPSSKPVRRKNSSSANHTRDIAEPTMTMHSRSATNDIYDMFNAPLKNAKSSPSDSQSQEDTEQVDGEDTDFGSAFDDEDGYSTATGDGESTGTGRVSAATSEFGDGDDTRQTLNLSAGLTELNVTSSVSPWSEFDTGKHVPRLSGSQSKDKDKDRSARSSKTKKGAKKKQQHTVDSQDLTSGGFDTQAINAIAMGDFENMDTMAIAKLAGDDGRTMQFTALQAGIDDEEDEDEDDEDEGNETQSQGEEKDQVTAPTSTTDAEVKTTSDVVTGADDENTGTPQSPASSPEIHTPPSDEDENKHEAALHTIPDSEPLETPTDEALSPFVERSSTRYIPLPPEDYEPTPMYPYRDPARVANSKLPFMTPIVERTESTLAPSTAFAEYLHNVGKTPSKPDAAHPSPSKLNIDALLMTSPAQSPASEGGQKRPRRASGTGATEEELLTSSPVKRKPLGGQIPFPITKNAKLGDLSDVTEKKGNLADDAVFKAPASEPKPKVTSEKPVAAIRKGPIIPDLQCNPCDDAVRDQILAAIHPPLASYAGFNDHSAESSNHYNALRSFAEKQSKKNRTSPKKQNEKTLTKAVPPILKFGGTNRVYAVKRELGAGAFAPVYLVDSYDPASPVDPDDDNSNTGRTDSGRGDLEALKTEHPPGTLAWEFHILRLVKQRLGTASRAMQSIILAHECHLFHDEAYIVLDYAPQGTLLDLVNIARAESVNAGKIAEGLEETLAMWFSIELLRTLEDLHRIGVLHGDLKGDNCLVRFEAGTELTGPFNSDGGDGWNTKGLKLIDFGRGIDVRMFKDNAQFIADWPSSPQDCAEIRECRPWKWQIDYHGAAGVIHSLLFGKYIETVPATGGGLGQKKEWKLKDNLKRYWEKELWGEVFHLLLNPTLVEGEEMPMLNSLKRLRMKMEKWLKDEGERGGRDLRGSLKRMERTVCVK